MSQNPHLPVTGSNQTGNLITTGNKLLQQAKGTYAAEIRRDQPTAIVFLVDQSGSMSSGSLMYKGVPHSKAELVARILNLTIETLIDRSTKDYGIGDYIDIAVIGYGQHSKEANYILQSKNGADWMSITELNSIVKTKKFKVVEKLRGVEKTQDKAEHWWIDAVAAYQTPMHSAFRKAISLLKPWVVTHSHSYPPVVINITDGAATDATDEQLLAAAQEIKSLATSDGYVLLFNCHIEDHGGDSLSFPMSEDDLPDDKYARLLFRMSSAMPNRYQLLINQNKGASTKAPYAAMSFNSGVNELLQMIDVGTRPSNPVK